MLPYTRYRPRKSTRRNMDGKRVGKSLFKRQQQLMNNVTWWWFDSDRDFGSE